MIALYNEWEPFPARWLRNLSDADLICPGHIDGRSITELTPDDVQRFTQCHFFAGIGTWSYALRSAGWADNRPIWTASLPCQPWSSAGAGSGERDERHLWPVFYRLVRECRPGVIVGEQVSSPDGLKWFDIVSADLERAGYAVAAVDLCAAGVGAPHIRQRLFWVAYSIGERSLPGFCDQPTPTIWRAESLNGGGSRRLEHADSNRRKGRVSRREDSKREILHGSSRCNSTAIDVAPADGFWSDIEWLYCKDDKYRPIKPGLSPLVIGFAGRVGRCRAFGNSIVAPLAALFMETVIETLDELGVV